MSKRKHPRRKKKKRASRLYPDGQPITETSSLLPESVVVHRLAVAAPTLPLSTIRSRLLLVNQRRASNG